MDDVNDSKRPLIPDPYCLMTGGYRALRVRMQQNPLPPWHERLPLAFWRGSTTGAKDIDPQNLELNRRYQLARMSLVWPHLLDASHQPSGAVPKCRSPEKRWFSA